MKWLVSHPDIYASIVITDNDLLRGNPSISDKNSKELLLAVSKYIKLPCVHCLGFLAESLHTIRASQNFMDA